MFVNTNTLQLSVVLGVAITLAGCSLLPGGSIARPSAGNVDKVQTTYAGNRSQHRIGRHFYAAIGMGRSRLEPDASEVPNLDVNQRVSTGSKLALGMDVNRQFSVELDTADLGSAGFSPGGRINYQVHSASALLYAGKQRHRYRRQGLTGYGRVGLGMLDNSAEDGIGYDQENAAHVLFGAGLEYMTRIGLGVRAEAVSYDSDARYAQLALLYRTGKRQSNRPVEIARAPAPLPAPTQVPNDNVIEAEPAVIPTPTIQPAPQLVTSDACEQFNGVLEGVNFHSDSDQLTDTAQVVLARAAQNLQQCPGVRILVRAHTDSVGSADYNKQLSAQRARSVMQSLVNSGIEKQRLKGRAFGESQPIDTNDTEEGRRRNRRVEVIAQ